MQLRSIFKPGEKEKGEETIFDSVPTAQKFILPTIVKEVVPGDKAIKGRAADYWVEIGETSKPVRYFRSFFAKFKGISTWAGMLDQLYLAEFGDADCDVAIHVIPGDQSRVLKDLARELAGVESDFYAEKNEAKRIAMQEHITDLREQIQRIRKEQEKLHGVSIEAMVSSNDYEKMDRFCSVMVKRYAGKSIFLRAADNRQLGSMMMATPLDAEDVYKDTIREMETSCVADLFPFGHGGIRHRSGVILGRDPYGKPVYYDAWHPSLENANMVVFGRAGSGKSFAVKLLTTRSLYQEIRTVVVDYEGEFKPMIKSLGFPYIELSHESKYRINIFDCDIAENEDGTKEIRLDETIGAALAAVVVMINAVDPDLINGMAKIKIQESIKSLYDERGITKDPNSLYETVRAEENGVFKTARRVKEMPTLYDLYLKIKQDPSISDIAEVLKTFTREGPLESQAVFDGQSTVTIENAFMAGISLKGLDETIMRPIGLFIATKWVWEKFANRNITEPKRIIVDEAQKAINDDLTAAWLIDSFRTARKRFVSMCAITQGFEVFLNKKGAEGILKNAPTKLMLRQEALDIDVVKDKFGFTEGEANFLLSAPKGTGILRAGDDSTIVYIEASPEEYELYTTDPRDFERKRESA